MEIEDRAAAHPRQFVLLKHVMPALAVRPTHWDLMIDAGEQLLTFELRQLPAAANCSLTTTRLADHRRVYLSFSGPLASGAAGNDRGSVERVAAGWAECHTDDSSGRVHCLLSSPELQAEFEYAPCAIGQTTQLAVFRWEQTPPAK